MLSQYWGCLKSNKIFFTFIAVVIYLPKSKADKRKSLLGNSNDSSDDEKVSEVPVFFFFSFYESFIPKMAMHVPHEFYCKVLKTNIECFNCWSFLILLQVAKDVQVDEKEAGPVEWTSYWKPNITINLVDDFTRYNCLNISSTDFLSVS